MVGRTTAFVTRLHALYWSLDTLCPPCIEFHLLLQIRQLVTCSLGDWNYCGVTIGIFNLVLEPQNGLKECITKWDLIVHIFWQLRQIIGPFQLSPFYGFLLEWNMLYFILLWEWPRLFLLAPGVEKLINSNYIFLALSLPAKNPHN